ncbi:hypothetical protein CRP01_15865 [Flavilitoribacter nigricans DSM 23189 = NBRC 102662]|uniref:HYR domain-containing protein n=1 Tax=Flavilitoribacter nigricans (strain ATCC 23147 / DSM 23189 / NBRC 102662 / NCIMB 1420 / SS-2) TaxID=1122177 RepID=A0A2D0NAT0_FLAN2|nr:hypothetical protein CRP01_15865 [Flavilitoribacter nigricans DSM 23189 = NBRC 102662]
MLFTKTDGNGTDRTPNNGVITYRLENNVNLAEAPVAVCQDVTIEVGGNDARLTPTHADGGSYDPDDRPLELLICDLEGNCSRGWGFTCRDIGETRSFTLQADNGILSTKCDFTVEIVQGPTETMTCPESVTVVPRDCDPVIRDGVLYSSNGESVRPDFELASVPACDFELEYYAERPDGTIDLYPQTFVAREGMRADTFQVGTTKIVYTASYEDENAVDQVQTCSFTVTVIKGESPLECRNDISVEVPPANPDFLNECKVHISRRSDDPYNYSLSSRYSEDDCGILTYSVIGPGIAPTVTTGSGNLDRFDFSVGTSTVVYKLEIIPGIVHTCSFTVSIDADTERDPIFTQCPTETVLLDIYEGISEQELLDQIDFAVAEDDCSIIMDYEFSGLDLDCSALGDIQNGVSLIAYNTSGRTEYCNFSVQTQNVQGVFCPNDITIYLETGACEVLLGAEQLAPVGVGCNEVYNYELLNDLEEILDSGAESSPEQLLSAGTYALRYKWTEQRNNGGLTVDVPLSCSFTIEVPDEESPIAQCQSQTVNLSSIPANLAELVGASSTDNCAIASFSIDRESFDCTDVGNVPVTLTVTDASGNNDACSVNLTVVDDLTITAQCQNVTVTLNESGTGLLTVAMADNGSYTSCDGGALEYSFDAGTPETEINYACHQVGIHNLVLNIKDENGSTASCNFTATVVDLTPPVIACNDISVNLDASGDASITPAELLGASADNCSTAIPLSATQTVFDCNDLGLNTVTLTVADAAGNENTCEATVTVLDNLAPTAVCVNASVYLDANGAGSVTLAELHGASTDNCSPVSPLSATQTNFDCTDLGANIVTLTVADALGNESTCEATVTVIDNLGPTAVCMNASVYLETNGAASVTLAALHGASMDNCSAVSPVSATQTVFDCTDLGSNTVTLTVADGLGNESTCEATVTVLDNVAPVAVCANATVYLDANGTGSVTPAQVHGASTDNCGVVNPLSVSPANFDCNNLGLNTATLTVTDVSGNQSMCEVIVTVVDGIAPVAKCNFTSINLDANGSASLTLEQLHGASTDNCGGVTPVSATQTNFDCTDVGIENVTLTVEDGSGNQSTCLATVTVLDPIAPTAVCQDISVELDANGAASITLDQIHGASTDNCTVVTPVSATQTQFDCADLGANTVTLTVEDITGLQSTCEAIVTVSDQIAPTAICRNTSVSLDQNGMAIVNLAQLHGPSTDNCDFVTPVSATQTEFDCSALGNNTVTLTVGDGSGNTATCTSTVEVLDERSPVIGCKSRYTINLDLNGQATVAAEDLLSNVSDNCTSIETLVYSLSNPDGSVFGRTVDCRLLGDNQVVVTVADGANNESSCELTVDVQDNLIPQARCQDVIVSLEQDGTARITAGMIDNGSSDNCEIVSVSFSPDAVVEELFFDCTQRGNHLSPITVTDQSGNQAICLATIRIRDDFDYCGDCEPNLTLSGTIDPGIYRSEDWIEADGVVEANTSVRLRAGSTVRLLPGFRAEPTSDLIIRIEDCDRPGINSLNMADETLEAPIIRDQRGDLLVYPNPFSDQVRLYYELEEETEIEIRLISVDGSNQKQVLRPQLQDIGTYQLEWSGRDLLPGLYIIQMRQGNEWSSRKLVKMR